ncbi:MAG: flippase-like domain-containing protein [Proteobacteria bacterium]|nr:flippase-like domain-containing protein [Pseudomonadota bacterium]
MTWLPALIVLPGLVAVVLHYSSLEKFAQLARNAQPEWLLPALGAQVGTYVFAALSWRQVLHRAGERRPFRTLFRLSVAKLYTDQAIPTGGVSGSILVMKALNRRGLSNGVGMAALLVSMVAHYAADVVAALGALSLLWLHHDADVVALALVSVFVVVEVAIPVAVLWGRSRVSNGGLPAWIDRLPLTRDVIAAVAEAPDDLLRDPRLIVETFGCQLAIILLDSLTLWLVCRAIGTPTDFWIAFCGYTIGDVVAMVAPSPLGLGTFEAGTTGTLALLGLPVEAALSATILLRGLTFWLPMLPGLWIARHEVSRL